MPGTTATPAAPARPTETAPGQAAGSGLQARLEIPRTLPLGDPVRLQFFLWNDTGQDLYLLNWFTPLEGLGGDIFRVRRDGRTVPYQGPVAERMEPTAEAYTLIKAGKIVWAEVDLTRAYDFSVPGEYTIAFNSPELSHIAGGETEMASTYDDLGPVQIASNEVTVTVKDDDSSAADVRAARAALVRYFSMLNEGQYADAVALHGAGYEILRDWNPAVDADDLARLLERGCLVNGLRCLLPRTVTAMGSGGPGTYTFAVQFEEPDGSLLVFEPGPDWADDSFLKSLFEFTVVKAGESFSVQELPVYMP